MECLTSGWFSLNFYSSVYRDNKKMKALVLNKTAMKVCSSDITV